LGRWCADNSPGRADQDRALLEPGETVIEAAAEGHTALDWHPLLKGS
jgi:hypothetical protein